MEAGQFVIPTLATIALGAALLVPLRDDRRGRRATLGGHQPLRPDFGGVAEANGAEAQPDSYVTEPIVENVPGADESESLVACVVEQHESEPRCEALDIDAPQTPDAQEIRLDDTMVRDGFEVIDLRELAHGATQNVTGPQQVREASPIRRWWRAFIARSLTDGRQTRTKEDGSSATIAPEDDGARTDTNPLPANETATIERSFAGELASLLGTARGDATEVADLPLAVDDPMAREISRAVIEPSPDEASSSAVLIRSRPAGDRVVPITRLPLRPQTLDVTWPHELDPPRIVSSRDDRHALLRTIGRTSDDAFARALEIAFQQEDVRGRLLALRALSRTTPTPRTHATFLEALKTGTDEERAMAIDSLVLHGQRCDLASACNDRVDAIAAQAALAFVASDRRADYRAQLQPFVDEARVETILILLWGVVE